jgi:preprotein translocase subunit SecE
MEDKITAYRKNIRNSALIFGLLANVISIFILSQGYETVLVFGVPYFALVFILHRYWDYFSETFNELTNQVTWTVWADVQRLTIIVAVFSIIFALLTWGVDEIFAKAIAGFFNIIK